MVPPKARDGLTVDDYGTGIVAFNAYPYDVGRVLDDESPPPEIAVSVVYDELGVLVERPWGDWNTVPGARNVMSQTYVLAENGGGPGALSINFPDAAFTGPAGMIAIDGNAAFCWATAELDQAPGDPGLAYMCQPTPDEDGSITLDVPAGKRLWVTYKILEVPDMAGDGAYVAPFSAGAV